MTNKPLFLKLDKSNIERKVKNRAQKKRKRLGYQQYSHSFSKIINSVPHNVLDKIICADSLNVLKSLPDNCIDIVVTSPPYNFGIDYDRHYDAISWKKYFEKLYVVLDECTRVLKYGGRLVINLQPMYSDYIPSHHLVSQHLFNAGLIWKSEILWEKNNWNCKYTAWGSWKSPSNPYMKYTWEYLEVFCKGSLMKEKEANKKIDITDKEFIEFVKAKWSIAPERNMKTIGHPAMFPGKLIERTLKLFSYKGDIVLDPFNGAGTTTMVAKKLGRHYIGIDIDKKYCRIANRRINNEY